ncbi:lipoprotein [Rhizobacter sp. Root1221]|uniref:lipoprotein n=1 Tax=Rhizobacter sp. Root1221 TaxID=1736433 RepID=UPI001F1B645F|nr:lipoprotein [Rhizobacter sp. Root1221]
MLHQFSSVPGRLFVAFAVGPLLAATLALTAGCGQKGPLTLSEGQSLQRPPPRPVTSPAAPPQLSPTDSPAIAPSPAPAASATAP